MIWSLKWLKINITLQLTIKTCYNTIFKTHEYKRHNNSNFPISLKVSVLRGTLVMPVLRLRPRSGPDRRWPSYYSREYSSGTTHWRRRSSRRQWGLLNFSSFFAEIFGTLNWLPTISFSLVLCELSFSCSQLLLTSHQLLFILVQLYCILYLIHRVDVL